MSSLVAISADFFTAFSALPKRVQGRVSEFIVKFKSNPQAPGFNYEKVRNSIDKKIFSVRIDDTYRGIAVRQPESGVYLLLWVDHHDAAYAWAERRKCEVNPHSGTVQIYTVNQTDFEHVPSFKGIFSHLTDEQLLHLDVPEEQLSFVRSLASNEDFYTCKDTLPDNAYENLEWIANGFSFKEIAREMELKQEYASYDLAMAIQTASS